RASKRRSSGRGEWTWSKSLSDCPDREARPTASLPVSTRSPTTRPCRMLRRFKGSMPVRTVIDRGPKGKRSVAFALDWPGWSRGAKTAELALETLKTYRDRYRPVAAIAGMADEFSAPGEPQMRCEQ